MSEKCQWMGVVYANYFVNVRNNYKNKDEFMSEETFQSKHERAIFVIMKIESVKI